MNMYLHGFTDPHIIEYDTLTSEERWNDYADIILANPPFMSPKGGIKPHKRFLVQATRSEVLFVDYIAEHLTPTGRAAVIVPEGIIFQSGAAYKQLREMLVKGYLVAVISLPAGIFNPYSGVKTSLLVMDKRLVKKTEAVLFAKIENDGFNLGAQRRAIDKNDLPAAARNIKAWLDAMRNDSPFDLATIPNLHRVEKARIAENGEWNLSAERYQSGPDLVTSHQVVEIGELIQTVTPPAKLQKPQYQENGRFPIIDQSQEEIAGWTDDNSAVIRPRKPLVIFGDHTCVVKLVKGEFVQGADGIKIIETREALLPSFLYHFLKVHPLVSVGYKRHFTDLKLKKIPLPSLDVQKEIVAEIEAYQKIKDGARQVVENYQPRIHVEPEWQMVTIGELCKPEYGFTATAQDRGSHRFIRITDITGEGTLRDEEAKYIDMSAEAAKFIVTCGDILVARTGATFGKTMLFNAAEPAIFASYLIRLRMPKERILAKYYWAFAQSENYWKQANALVTGGGQPQFNGNVLVNVTVPIPDLDTQRAIVAQIEEEQRLVNSNQELVRLFDASMKATINRVWGEAE